MASESFLLDADEISDTDFQSFSQMSNQSQFRTDNDTDAEYEDESQEIPSSENFSSQEFSQVYLGYLLYPSS